jgi:hypothetical protein
MILYVKIVYFNQLILFKKSDESSKGTEALGAKALRAHPLTCEGFTIKSLKRPVDSSL